MLGFIFTTLTAIRAFTLEPGQEVTTSGGITIAKPSNNITDATLRPDGVLVVKYEDGTTKEVSDACWKQAEKETGVSLVRYSEKILLNE